MCGICGIAGKGVQIKDLDAFEDLLWVSSLRGHHSTGVFSYNPSRPKKKYNLQKELGPSPLFIIKDNGKKPPESQLDSVMAEVLMGHCRYATKGKITRDNAHPFDTGRYVSAHNGTLLDSKYKHSSKTDSEMMFEDMEKRGVNQVIDELDYYSAYALSIFDKHRKVLTLGTNGDRPLYGMYNTERRVFYWASELSALHFVADRRKLKVEFVRFEKNHFYSTSIDNISTDGKFWSVIEFEKKKPEITVFDDQSWLSDSIAPNKLEAFCCCCGTILYGKAKEEADVVNFNGESYYTCADCFDNSEKETSVG